MSESELLTSLPLLVKDVAELWYDSHKNSWQTWDEFRQAARRRWGTRLDLQERLQLEIAKHFQQEDEPVRLYITCLESMLWRLSPRPAVTKQLDTLYENMLPQLKRLVLREDCRTVDDLLDKAIWAEITLEKEKGDRTLISADYSVMPEAYATIYASTSTLQGEEESSSFPQIASVEMEDQEMQLSEEYTEADVYKLILEAIEKWIARIEASSPKRRRRRRRRRKDSQSSRESTPTSSSESTCSSRGGTRFSQTHKSPTTALQGVLLLRVWQKEHDPQELPYLFGKRGSERVRVRTHSLQGTRAYNVATEDDVIVVDPDEKEFENLQVDSTQGQRKNGKTEPMKITSLGTATAASFAEGAAEVCHSKARSLGELLGAVFLDNDEILNPIS